MSEFRKEDSLGAQPPEQIAAYLREIGDEEAAREIEARHSLPHPAPSSPASPTGEELVEAMARAIAEDEGYDVEALIAGRLSDEAPRWSSFIDKATAALAIASPIITAQARAMALEEAARVVDPGCKRPCGCDRCDCGNYDDAAAVAVWDSETENAKRILALKDRPHD